MRLAAALAIIPTTINGASATNVTETLICINRIIEKAMMTMPIMMTVGM